VTQLVTSGAGTAYSYIVVAGLVSLNHYFSVYIIDCRFVPFHFGNDIIGLSSN
jgi:hypothetical protein